MKLKLTVKQIKILLALPETKVKLPITIDLGKVSKTQAQEIIDLIKEKRD